MTTATCDRPLTNATTRLGPMSRRSGFRASLPTIAVVTEVTELRSWRVIETTMLASQQPTVKAEAMATIGRVVQLSAEMAAYLRDEVERRGSDIATVYQEEMAAKEELTRITPRNAYLLRIAERFPAPQAWYDE
jgi:hypothetical protein